MQEIYQTTQVKTWLTCSSSIMLEKRNSYIYITVCGTCL